MTRRATRFEGVLAAFVLFSIGCSSNATTLEGFAMEGGLRPDAGTGGHADTGAVRMDASPADDSPSQGPRDAQAPADAMPSPGAGGDAGFPVGWLYTSGAKILVSNGTASGAPWMGRGVNIDDLFLCGYNSSLWMTAPDQTVESIASDLITNWKPSFVRISLAMSSFGTVVSWVNNPGQYRTPMTNAIDAITAKGVYVLVTLRSDASMIGQDPSNAEPTGLPSDSTTTPNAAQFPTGTDATYQALVDAFAQSGHVLFGLTNEPGGNTLSNTRLAAAMNHAVGTIRAEEDKLGVPHHLVSVQGNSWTSDISFYAAVPSPITHDNVVYEVHGYPPATSSYTYSNIPVIIGEYGSVSGSAATALYADLEAKQIPNLAWDFEPYSDCSPDLVDVTQSATSVTATSWGMTVQAYLSAH
jgi:hypothetical protein